MTLEVRAVAKYIRMSPQKVRLVTDLVRGMDVQEAMDLLRFTPKAAAYEVRKVLQSAIANAEENYGVTADELYIAEITADDGPTLKRGRPGARGRYKPILKRSAHISVVLASKLA